MPPLDRALTIFVTAASIFIGNRYLDGFRQQQEQKKVAKLLISSIEGHLESLDTVFNWLEQKHKHISLDLPKLANLSNREVNYIKNDPIYESAIQNIAVIALKYIDFITRYSRYSKILNSILEDILLSYNNKTINTDTLISALGKCQILQIDSQLLIMTLSHKILQEREKFNEYKELVKQEYSKFRVDIKKYAFNPEEIAISLIRIEELFEEFGLRAELEDTYNQKKIELKNE